MSPIEQDNRFSRRKKPEFDSSVGFSVISAARSSSSNRGKMLSVSIAVDTAQRLSFGNGH
jgi:hypothetical protein